MTDNEIVIALRAVAKNYEGKIVRTFETNVSAMATDAADHIERLCDENNFLRAEIEKLNKEVDRLSQVVLYHDGHIADAKSEARKELAERLKEHYSVETTDNTNNPFVTVLYDADELIDNLLKEMED